MTTKIATTPASEVSGDKRLQRELPMRGREVENNLAAAAAAVAAAARSRSSDVSARRATYLGWCMAGGLIPPVRILLSTAAAARGFILLLSNHDAPFVSAAAFAETASTSTSAAACSDAAACLFDAAAARWNCRR